MAAVQAKESWQQLVLVLVLVLAQGQVQLAGEHIPDRLQEETWALGNLADHRGSTPRHVHEVPSHDPCLDDVQDDHDVRAGNKEMVQEQLADRAGNRRAPFAVDPQESRFVVDMSGRVEEQDKPVEDNGWHVVDNTVGAGLGHSPGPAILRGSPHFPLALMGAVSGVPSGECVLFRWIFVADRANVERFLAKALAQWAAAGSKYEVSMQILRVQRRGTIPSPPRLAPQLARVGIRVRQPLTLEIPERQYPLNLPPRPTNLLSRDPNDY